MSKQEERDYTALTTDASYDYLAKQAFAKVARKYLRRLAVALGLPKGSYEIRFNPAGQAVSGDVILHAEHVYVWIEQRPFSRDRGYHMVLYRGCHGRKDYCGMVNNYVDADGLMDTPRLAMLCREVMHQAELAEGARSALVA